MLVYVFLCLIFTNGHTKIPLAECAFALYIYYTPIVLGCGNHVSINLSNLFIARILSKVHKSSYKQNTPDRLYTIAFLYKGSLFHRSVSVISLLCGQWTWAKRLFRLFP